MATGNFWRDTNTDKPWGPMDPDDKLSIPLDVSDMLDGMATAYASHEILAQAPLECTAQGTHASGVIAGVRLQLAVAAEFSEGQKAPFTLRLVGADGQQRDRTLWLKIKSR